MRNDRPSPNFSAWIDLFRWVAALSVLVTHIDIRMLAPVAETAEPSLARLAYAFAAGFDHHAVMVFFVLSGLLVGGPVMRALREAGRISYSQYLLKRWVRLAVVLWPAFAVGALCTAGAIQLGAIHAGVLPGDIAQSLGWPVLLCNATFLQTAACTQFAGNGALWSLFNEFWYYVTFPALALATVSTVPWQVRAGLATAAAVLLAALTAGQYTGSPIGPYMLIWGLGVAVATLRRPLVRSVALTSWMFVAALLAVRLLVRRSFAELHPVLSAELDLVVSCLFGLMLLAMRHSANLAAPKWVALHQRLAGFSFSLYCIHVPILTLYITVLMALTGMGWQMAGDGPAPWLAVAGALAACLGASWGFSRITEAQTGRVRRLLSARPAIALRLRQSRPPI